MLFLGSNRWNDIEGQILKRGAEVMQQMECVLLSHPVHMDPPLLGSLNMCLAGTRGPQVEDVKAVLVHHGLRDLSQDFLQIWH